MGRTVVIVRGWPGCGKSTLAYTLATQYVDAAKYFKPYAIVSADNYFMLDGEYKFDRSKISLAHAECRDAFSHALRKNVPLVIVDNTNIKRKDYDWYVQVAVNECYEVYQCLAPGVVEDLSPEECFKRNVHNVPLETIARMKKEFEIDNRLEHFVQPTVATNTPDVPEASPRQGQCSTGRRLWDRDIGRMR